MLCPRIQISITHEYEKAVYILEGPIFSSLIQIEYTLEWPMLSSLIQIKHILEWPLLYSLIQIEHTLELWLLFSLIDEIEHTLKMTYSVKDEVKLKRPHNIRMITSLSSHLTSNSIYNNKSISVCLSFCLSVCYH